MATARRLILEFLKASIADLITLLFSSLQNSEGGGDGDSGDRFRSPLVAIDRRLLKRVN
jgi:hypothetical protein